MNWQIKMLLGIATLIVRFTYNLSRTLNLGEGSNIPGKIALRLFPDLLKVLIPRYKNGVVLVTGTNGKTTTTKILVELVRNEGFKVCTNAKGANLLSGIVTSILLERVRLDQLYVADYAVFEIDEAVLIKSFKMFQPRVLIVTNFSRDQLDRYGEVDSNVNRIINLVRDPDCQCRLVLNGNDPNVARIGSVVKTENRLYFGIKEEVTSAETGLLVEKDTGAGVELSNLVLPSLDLWADSIEADYLNGSRFNLGGVIPAASEVAIKLPGVFNILNSLAALAAGIILGNDLQKMLAALSNVAPSYGRSERFNFRGVSVFLFLVKNPVGFNHIIQLLNQSHGEKRVLFLLNDLTADGKDVSWIWDVALENIWNVAGINEAVTSGTRAGDMALRIKYSNAPQIPLTVEYQPRRAFEELVRRLKPGEELMVLANYTSMIKFRPFLLKICRQTA